MSIGGALGGCPVAPQAVILEPGAPIVDEDTGLVAAEALAPTVGAEEHTPELNAAELRPKLVTLGA